MNRNTSGRRNACASPFTLAHHLFLVCALAGLAGCGPKNTTAGDEAADAAAQSPATVAQAAAILDLSTIPLVDGAKPPWPPRVAGLSYNAGGSVQNAFEFHRKNLVAAGWKELPNTSVTEQSASGTFSRKGYLVSLSAFPNGQGTLLVTLQNHGNIRPGKLPVPGDVKPVYVGDVSAMYVTEATVPATAAACRALLTAQGWVPYGGAGDSANFKQNAVLLHATVSSAPAQGGKTMIAYTTELLSADIPAPPEVPDPRYTDQTQELSFEAALSPAALGDFYRKSLAAAKWEATLDHAVEIDGKDTLIFRNPAKDMLTLTMSSQPGGNTRAAVHFQSAAEIAELDRQIEEQAPALRAAAAAKQAEEAKRTAEANQPLPKIALRLPPEATNFESQKGELRFTVGHGKARATAETLQKQFAEMGWKEEMAGLDTYTGALSFTKGNQHVTISYTDTGLMPSEVSISAMGAELERQ